MPTACRQSPEHAVARGLLVEMEGLRIELGREGLAPVHVDPQPARRAVGLPCGIVLEISVAHSCTLPQDRAARGPRSPDKPALRMVGDQPLSRQGSWTAARGSAINDGDPVGG